jgi:hypothetical protein
MQYPSLLSTAELFQLHVPHCIHWLLLISIIKDIKVQIPVGCVGCVCVGTLVQCVVHGDHECRHAKLSVAMVSLLVVKHCEL